MAACHPKLKTHPGAELFLSRFADGDWRGIVRPWLLAGRGALARSIVVAPTRGQTQALKQRCVAEGISLLGVEFLTPGLARKKRGAPNGLGRSLQILVLRSLIEGRLSALGPVDPSRLLWKSLSSDLENALRDYEDLLRGEFSAEHFPTPELRELFTGLERWVEAHGFALGPVLDRRAALDAPPEGAAPPADRLLLIAGGPENWPEFFGLLALAYRCPSACVIVPEPEFSGRSAAGEEWVGIWEKALGVEQAVADADDPAGSCASVAGLWAGGEGSAAGASAIVARSRAEEALLVADRVERLLKSGSESVAVVFPGASAGVARLGRELAARGIDFADLVGSAGTPPVDTRIQRALADFYDRGCRMEELLQLWPLLQATNLTSLPLPRARRVCETLFDEHQSHSLEPHAAGLAASDEPDPKEVGRIALLLLPAWPASLALADALERFDAANRGLGLAVPDGWYALRDFAARAPEPMPRSAILEAIRSFIPEKGPEAATGRAGGFSRVTLTTCRRAVGVAWSDCILTESNAGSWPERREPSCWLGDEERRGIVRAAGRLSISLPTSDERMALERSLYCSIARDTSRSVSFSASLFSEEEPELMLGPNAWLERVMWDQGLFSAEGGGPDAFLRLARARPASEPAGPPDGWAAVWLRRRDPKAPFDAHFLGDPSGASRPARLSASQVERAVTDPATLWFDAVLGVRRVEWRPFARARRKAVGIRVHAALAASLKGLPAEGGFRFFPERGHAEARLEAELARLRLGWPADRYWDSFHGDVAEASRELLAQVYALPAATFVAVEIPVPKGSTVAMGPAGRVPVIGRMDLVLADRPGWDGARVAIVDFKTGGGAGLSAGRMRSSGLALQLGVYLLAAGSAGASGAVWMLKPGERPALIGSEEAGEATAKLEEVGRHLSSGLYGALTRDRDEYTRVFEWPLASSPVPFAVLQSKYAATFGSQPGEGADE